MVPDPPASDPVVCIPPVGVLGDESVVPSIPVAASVVFNPSDEGPVDCEPTSYDLVVSVFLVLPDSPADVMVVPVIPDDGPIVVPDPSADCPVVPMKTFNKNTLF